MTHSINSKQNELTDKGEKLMEKSKITEILENKSNQYSELGNPQIEAVYLIAEIIDELNLN